VSFPAETDGDYFFAEIFSGHLFRIREDGGSWVLPADLPGQPAPGIWGDGFIGLCDLRLGPDGAVYLVSLGLNPVLPRGLHRIRVDPAFTGAPEPARDRLPDVRAVPNPARPAESVALRYRSRVAGEATIRVHDVRGRRLASFTDALDSAGERTLFLGDAELGGSGVRFVTVTTADGRTGQVKVVRLR
jgi:hypothetical protein